MYADSDGSVKYDYGAHTYNFTSGNKEDKVWGGADITPGSVTEISSLRAYIVS